MPTTIRDAIRVEFERQRERDGLSLSELARRAGVHYAGLHGYLAGKKDLNTETASRVMRALGMSARR